MKASPVSTVFVVMGLLTGASCSTVSLTRLDRCTVRRTMTVLTQKEEVLFCDDETPAWSGDRAVRLTQECLYQHRQMHHDALVSAIRNNEPVPATEDDAIKQCLPTALRTVQAENDALKERLARADANQTRMEGRHAELENGLTKALNRPINAVADARANSDSSGSSSSDSDFTPDKSESTPARAVVIVPRSSAQPHRAVPKTAVAEDKPEEKHPACPVCPAPAGENK